MGKTPEMTGFDFRPAVRRKVNLLIALAGASGSGKTFSALELATGMAPGGEIAFLDTEARRALHYADRYKFMHADLRPPFPPEKFTAGIQAAEKSGARVVIIDSMSHEYDGEGGIMDWADQLAEKGVKSPGNWKEPKLAHKKMMNALLQARCHVIFCLRAEEKIRIAQDPTTRKTVVEPLGWMPICEKRFMFEMTLSLTLRPDDPGRPHYDLPHKIQDQHRSMFPEGRHISRDAGRMLAEWADGAEPEAAGRDDLIATARGLADQGAKVFTPWYRGLSDADRGALDGERDDLKARMDAAKKAQPIEMEMEI